MTIIQPNKNKNFIRFFFFVFFLLLIGGGIYIYEYNSFVDIRHERNALKKDIMELQNINADLKNKFYTAIDYGDLETLAQNYNLILERKPGYLSN